MSTAPAALRLASTADAIDRLYSADAWQAGELGVPARRGRDRVSFAGIEPGWLREALKWWSRQRLAAGTAVPDRIQRLQQAAQARHEQTMRRAEAALNSLARRGGPVTIRGVADAARVSRSWIYQQPWLLAEIHRLRQPGPGKPAAVPASQQATIGSLRQQLQAYREEITRLRAEIASLYQQLARQLGAARTAAITTRIENIVDMSTTPRS